MCQVCVDNYIFVLYIYLTMLNKYSRKNIKNNFVKKYEKRRWDKEEIDMLEIYEQVSQDNPKRTPGGYIATCPFPDHDDSTPSFVMYVDTDSYHCFGCNKSGSASWFKREMERIYGI